MGAIAVLFWVLVSATLLIRRYLGWPTNITLLPYQKGVLYKKGYAVRDVGPGGLRVGAGIEKVIIVDTRAIPVSFENRPVALTDGQTAVFGFSASAEVEDAHKALYSAQNYSQVPAFVLLICSRIALNQQSGANLKISQVMIEEQIMKHAKVRLESQGFSLLSFRLTQLSIAGPPSQTTDKPVSTATA
jgi:hypothetical protein